jgi:tetratricopeptide (TPR) repeat protein
MMKTANVMMLLGALALGAAACEKKPDEAEIHKDLGRDHLDKQEWPQAIAEYELSLKADPNQEEVWKQKAVAHMKSGDKEKAAEAFAKTADFRKEPAKKAEVFRNLAGMFMQSNDYDKAEVYFNEALKHEPKDDQSYAWLAEIYAQKGGARANEAPAQPPHLEKALSYYDKAIAANPNTPNNHINKRVVYVKLSGYEQAQKDLAEGEARTAGKDQAKADAAKAKAEKHAARIEELKKLMEESMKKYVEAQKAAAAAPPASK